MTKDKPRSIEEESALKQLVTAGHRLTLLRKDCKNLVKRSARRLGDLD